jgi:hypothetical protein
LTIEGLSARAGASWALVDWAMFANRLFSSVVRIQMDYYRMLSELYLVEALK